MPTRLRLSCRALLIIVLVRPNFYLARPDAGLPPAQSGPVRILLFAELATLQARMTLTVGLSGIRPWSQTEV